MMALGDAKSRAQAEADTRLSPQARSHAKDKADKYQALHDLLLTWLPRLAPGGRAVMVVGKNLGADSLQRWLGEQGWPTTRLASAKGFRILETRRG